jgi:hypothetical protein
VCVRRHSRVPVNLFLFLHSILPSLRKSDGGLRAVGIIATRVELTIVVVVVDTLQTAVRTLSDLLDACRKPVKRVFCSTLRLSTALSCNHPRPKRYLLCSLLCSPRKSDGGTDKAGSRHVAELHALRLVPLIHQRISVSRTTLLCNSVSAQQPQPVVVR